MPLSLSPLPTCCSLLPLRAAAAAASGRAPTTTTLVFLDVVLETELTLLSDQISGGQNVLLLNEEVKWISDQYTKRYNYFFFIID